MKHDQLHPPIYCFRVVDDDYTIKRIVITDYTCNIESYGRRYRFTHPDVVDGQKGYALLTADKFDKYLYKKVFTWNDDIEAVHKIIYLSLRENLKKANAAVAVAESNMNQFVKYIGGKYSN